MLLQSHAGELCFLPALPRSWVNGRITGLRARGGFTVDLEWEKQAFKSAVVRSTLGGLCRIRIMRLAEEVSSIIVLNQGQLMAQVPASGPVIELVTTAGAEYWLKPSGSSYVYSNITRK